MSTSTLVTDYDIAPTHVKGSHLGVSRVLPPRISSWLSRGDPKDFMSNALSDGYVNASLMFARLARILLVVFVTLGWS